MPLLLLAFALLFAARPPIINSALICSRRIDSKRFFSFVLLQRHSFLFQHSEVIVVADPAVAVADADDAVFDLDVVVDVYSNLIHFEISDNRSPGLRWMKKNILLQRIRNERSVMKCNETSIFLYTKSSMDVKSNEWKLETLASSTNSSTQIG